MTNEEYQAGKKEVIEKLTKSLTENYINTELQAMYQDANSWNGEFPFIDAVDFETLVDWFCGEPLKLCEMLAEGQYDTSLLFRLGDCGLENLTQDELDEEMGYYLDDLANYIFDNYGCRNSSLEEYLNEDDVEMLENFFRDEDEEDEE